MVCPKCGNGIGANGYCETCGITVSVYNKIKNRSKLLYNQALQKASVRDLSGAIDLLNRSVRLDKNNIDARNLLGLIYFEIGETVTALSHWVISKNLRSDNNEALYYLDRIQNNQSYLDKLNQAIKKYNQALHYIQQNSVDLAVIQLKKVISLNDHFVQAYCLLALCYIKENQNDKAKKVLKKVLTIDKSNYVARKYQEAMVNSESGRNDFEADQPEKEAGMALRPRVIKPSGTFLQFASMAAGIAIGLAIMGLMIMPSRLEEKDKELVNRDNDIVSLNEQIDNHLIEKESLEENIASLEAQLTALESDLEASEEDKVAVASVLESMDIYVSGDMIGAARSLYEVDATRLPEEVGVIYTRLIETIYPAVGDQAYLTGKKSYDNGKLEEAVTLLQDSYRFNPTGDYADNALYYLGRSYYKLDNLAEALPVFKKVVAEFPDSRLVDDAEYFINIIE